MKKKVTHEVRRKYTTYFYDRGNGARGFSVIFDLENRFMFIGIKRLTLRVESFQSMLLKCLKKKDSVSCQIQETTCKDKAMKFPCAARAKWL
jgi:hypothetical protein